MELLARAKRVLSQYELLVAKMAADYDAHVPTRTLYHLLTDIKFFAIMPLFEKALINEVIIEPGCLCL